MTASVTQGGVARNVQLDWSSANPAIASVSAGNVTGVAFGRTTIYARSGASVDSTNVMVLPAQIEMQLSPSAVSAALGDTIDFEIQSSQGIRTPDVQWHVSDTTAASLVRDGSLATKNEGTVQLTAQLGVQQAVATVKVTRSPVSSIAITPSVASLVVGATQQFSATLYDSRGRPITGSVTWASSNTAVAAVSASGLVTAEKAGGTIITATSNGVSSSVAVNVSSTPATRVVLTLPNDSIGVKQMFQATVKAYDAAGNLLAGRTMAFQSSNPSVATVSNAGVVTGLVGGQSTISVICDGLVSSVPLTVVGSVPTTLVVTPTNNVITLGGTTQLVAEVRDQFGIVMTGQTIGWWSQSPAIASVSLGKVTGVASGTTNIRASVGSLVTSASVTVQSVAVASVALTPSTGSVEEGKTLSVTATAYDASGNVLSNRPVTYTSANTAVASVSALGVVSGIDTGEVSISATVEGKIAASKIKVTPPPASSVASVVLTLNSSSLNVGQTTQATVHTYDANGVELVGRTISFASLSPSIATVSSSGVVTAVASGSGVITATSEGKTGNASLTVAAVSAPVATVSLSAPATALSIPDSAQLVVVLKDANGNVLNGRTISYNSSNIGVATVSPSGLVKSISAGSATISATSEGKSTSLSFSVTVAPPPPAPVANVAVTLNASSILVGQGTQAAATLTDASGNVLSNRTISWSSSNPAVATVSQAGYVSGAAAGSATISATSEGVTSSAVVAVQAPVVTITSVTVSLGTSSLTVGQATTATAVAKDASGNVVSGQQVSWNSTSPAIASVGSSTSATTTVSALAAGSASIVATVGGISGSASASVTQPVATPIAMPTMPKLLNYNYPTVTGKTWVVTQATSLQTVLNNAVRGDEIVIDAGATFSGNFVLPAKAGTSANGWIIIRSAALSQLPARGTRVGPANASLMPKIITPNVAPALKTAPGTSGWWIAGVEFSTAPATTAIIYRVVQLGDGAAQTSMSQMPTDIVLDRVYMHPQANQNVQRCLEMNSGATQVTDSYLYDCHAKGYDSQAIIGWNGSGPYKIVNNMLAGAGENILFGGGDPSIANLIPSDVEFRRNYVYTPDSWKGVWTKKNIFETKNVKRVWMEGNVFQGSWADGQTGFALVLKVSNQGGSCTWCAVTDLTIRNNIIRNVGGGIAVMGITSGAGNPIGELLSRVLIEGNLVENVNTGIYTGEARLVSVMNNAQDVTIRRNTFQAPGAISQFLNLATDPAATNFAWEENIASYGTYGFFSSWYGVGENSLKGFRGTVSMARYVMIGTSKSGYPNGSFASDMTAAEATGRGANRTTVNSATAGVAIP